MSETNQTAESTQSSEIFLTVTTVVGKDRLRRGQSLPTPASIDDRVVAWLNEPISEPISNGRTPTRAGAILTLFVILLTVGIPVTGVLVYA